MGIDFGRAIQKYTKFANFAVLYFQNFTMNISQRNFEILLIECDVLLSYGDIFVSTCLQGVSQKSRPFQIQIGHNLLKDRIF